MTVRLKAPKGMTSFSLAGFAIDIAGGYAEVEPHHVAALRSHGFTLEHGEAEATIGSRSGMVSRFVNDARRFAERLSDADLIAFSEFSAARKLEEVDAAWGALIKAVKAEPEPVKIDPRSMAPKARVA